MTTQTSKFFKAGMAAAVVVSGVAATTAPMSANANEGLFNDVSKENQYYNYIMNLVEREIVSGFPEDNTFRPNAQLTRGQAAKILAGILNLDTENVVDPGFKDISKNHDYYGAIAALENAGIIDGYQEDNTFRSSEPIKRNHMAKMVAIGFGLEAQNDELPFTDVSDHYKEYIAALYENNVTTGKTATTFDGLSNVTRGHISKFVVLADQVEKEVTFTVENGQLKSSKGKFVVEMPLVNAENKAALENAEITATIKNGEVQSIASLSLNTAGTEENPVVFDGGNTTIDNVAVNADYVSLKNLTVNHDVVLTSNVEDSFAMDNVVINGELVINEEAKAQTASLMGLFANVQNGPKVELTNSTIKTINAKRNNVVISSNKQIQEVKIAEGVSAIQLDANVGKVAVNVLGNLAISGEGTIDTVQLEKAGQLSLNVKGQVKEVDVKDAEAKVEVGADAKIEKLVVPTGKDASSVISNYDDVKENITEVVGETDVENDDDQTSGNDGDDETTNLDEFIASLELEVTENFAGLGLTKDTKITEISGTNSMVELMTKVNELQAEGIEVLSIAGQEELTMANVKAALIDLMAAEDRVTVGDLHDVTIQIPVKFGYESVEQEVNFEITFDTAGLDLSDEGYLANFVAGLETASTENFADLGLTKDTKITEISGTNSMVELMTKVNELQAEGIEVLSIAGQEELTMANVKAALIDLMTAEDRVTVGDLNDVTIQIPVKFGYESVEQEVNFEITFDTAGLDLSDEGYLASFVAGLETASTENFADLGLTKDTKITEISGTNSMVELMTKVNELQAEGIEVLSIAGQEELTMANVKAALIDLMTAEDRVTVGDLNEVTIQIPVKFGYESVEQEVNFEITFDTAGLDNEPIAMQTLDFGTNFIIDENGLVEIV